MLTMTRKIDLDLDDPQPIPSDANQRRAGIGLANKLLTGVINDRSIGTDDLNETEQRLLVSLMDKDPKRDLRQVLCYHCGGRPANVRDVRGCLACDNWTCSPGCLAAHACHRPRRRS